MAKRGATTSTMRRQWISFYTAAIIILGSSVLYQFWRTEGLSFFIIWLASSGGICSIFIARLRQAAIQASQEEEALSRMFRGYIKAAPERRGQTDTGRESRLEEQIKEHLKPRMETLRGLDQVCREAARTIVLAHEAREDQNRFITFYGSASLSTVHTGSRRFGERRISNERDEDIQTPEQIYAGALEAAASDQVRIRRYIRLFTEDEFKKRGRAVQEEYVSWLKAQYYQLNRNPNYRLTNVVRAPLWGSNIARIVTHSRLLELVGSGEAGLLLVGENIAEAIRRHTRESILGTKECLNQPIHYSQSKPWSDVMGEGRTPEQFLTIVLRPMEKLLEESTRESEH